MTEQNNEQMMSAEVSRSNGNGGHSKKILVGAVLLVLAAAIAFFIYRSFGVRKPTDLLRIYAKTAERVQKQVEYHKEMQKKLWTKSTDSKMTLALEELPQGMLPFPNGQLDIGLKNDPEGKKLQFSLAAILGGSEFLMTKGELNEDELLIDLGEYSEKLLALPTKEFGAKFNEFNVKQGGEAASIDSTLDISYSKIFEKVNTGDVEAPKEYKDALLALVEGVNVDKVDDGYQMIIPNENVRTGVKRLYEVMKTDPRLAGMDATRNREELFNNAIKQLEETTDEITLDVFTKVSKGIASEVRLKILINGAEEFLSALMIGDPENVLNDWTWEFASSKKNNSMVTVSGNGVLSKEKTDYHVNVSAPDNKSLSMNFSYGNPETSGDLKIGANMMVNGEEAMSFLLGGKYSNENGVQKFVSDVGTVRIMGGSSEEVSEVNFSLESETKEKVDSFYTFDKERHLLFDASKEENDMFLQAIMGKLFMKLMGM